MIRGDGKAGEMPTGGEDWMRYKLEVQKGQEPRTLTAADIRLMVEDIAESLALKMHPEQAERGEGGQEAVPIDTRRFVSLMSEYIRMN